MAEVSEPVPPGLAPDRPVITRLLEHIGIEIVGVADHEAEDVIATLTWVWVIGAAHDPAVDAVRRHLWTNIDAPADECFDHGANTKAASTRRAFVATSASLVDAEPTSAFARVFAADGAGVAAMSRRG